jgi:energy-coupling factor transporter ATP-binding protein EcfA2
MVDGVRNSEYCSFIFRIWADSIERAEQIKKSILALTKDHQMTSPMVSICWAFLTAKGDLKKVYIEELVDDTLYDEAYPELEGGVAKFITDFLASSESILVLQGQPGTGKTRLIRSILGAMAKQKDTKVSALYTGDKKSMESDEIFVEFVTGEEEVFVIEDADYILKPRSDGNEHLHRFLTIADGVVRSQGRKIIFSTNLSNLGDIDDALIRPGRCFARIMFREHTKSEAVKLLERLCGGNIQRAQVMSAQLAESDKNTYSLAEIYKRFEQSNRLESGEDVIRRVSEHTSRRIGF